MRAPLKAKMANLLISLRLKMVLKGLKKNGYLQLNEGEKAYFSTEDGGFTYTFQATNLDGKTFSHEVRRVTDVQHGILYKVCYGFSSDSSVSATQNMEEP